MDKLKSQIAPEDIFSQALDEVGLNLSDGDMRLLLSGLAALRAARENHVNKNELKAIRSLIAYVSCTQSVSEETVESVLTTKFEVNTVKTLPSRHYNDIIEYLIDVQIKSVVN